MVPSTVAAARPRPLLCLLLALLAAGVANGDPATTPAGDRKAFDLAVRSAVEASDLAALRAALAKGGRADQKRKFGVTLLMEAAGKGADEVASELLAAGARVDATTSFGETVLAFAVRGGNSALIARLLKAGAAIDAEDDHGTTPLRAAVDRGRLDLVRQLLAAGADPNRAAENGSTPLQIAASKGALEIAQELVARGARSDVEDVAGRDALAFAAEGGDAETIRWLEKLTGRRAPEHSLGSAGGRAVAVSNVDFQNFVFELEGRRIEVVRGAHAAKEAGDLAVDSVTEILSDLAGAGALQAAVLVRYGSATGEARTVAIAWTVRDGRLVEIGRLPVGLRGRSAILSLRIDHGQLVVDREAEGGGRTISRWKVATAGLEEVAHP